jgi:ArsR family transcriptional regulator
MRDLIKAAKAISDETRLRILNLLLQRECCVCEVMQVLKISQTRASRNLIVLHDAGFLEVRREGLWAYYSIDKPNLREYMSTLLKAIERYMTDSKIASLDREHLKTAERLGPQCCGPSQGKELVRASSKAGGEN